jgi:hypothetical protein
MCLFVHIEVIRTFECFVDNKLQLIRRWRTSDGKNGEDFPRWQFTAVDEVMYIPIKISSNRLGHGRSRFPGSVESIKVEGRGSEQLIIGVEASFGSSSWTSTESESVQMEEPLESCTTICTNFSVLS